MGIIPNLDSQKCNVIYSVKNNGTISIEFICSGKIVATLYVIESDKFEYFQTLKISKASPMWKFQKTNVLEF